MLNLKKLLTKIINRFRVVNTGSMQTMGESGVYYMVNAVTDKPEATGGTFLLNRPTHDTGCGLYIPNTAYANLYKVSIANGSFTYTPIVSSTLTKVTDCNDAVNPNLIYYLNGDSTNKNKPNSGWIIVRSFFLNGNGVSNFSCYQIAVPMNNTAPTMWVRSRSTSNVWGSWKTITMS